MRALIVDDSKAMRMIIKGILTDFGFEVAEAEHGVDAMNRLNELGAMELAVIDWNMPEMNGYEFVKSVRANRTYNAMRLMMVTTETEMSQITKVLNAGANEYVMKPFTRDVIRQKLQLMGINLS